MSRIIVLGPDLKLGDRIFNCRIVSDGGRTNQWVPWGGILISAGDGSHNITHMHDLYKARVHEFEIERAPSGEGFMEYVKGQGWVYV